LAQQEANHVADRDEEAARREMALAEQEAKHVADRDEAVARLATEAAALCERTSHLDEERVSLHEHVQMLSVENREAVLVSAERDGMREKLAEVLQEIGATSAERDALKDQLSEVGARATDYCTRLRNECEVAMEGATSEHAALQQQALYYYQELSAVSSQRDELKEEVARINTQLGAATSDFHQQQQKLSDSDKAHESLSAERDDLRQQLVQVSNSCSLLRNECEVAMEGATSEHAALQQQALDVYRELSAVSSQRDELKEEVAHINTELGTATSDFDQRQQRLNESDKARESLSAERDDLRQQLVQVSENCQHLGCRNADLTSQLASQVSDASAERDVFHHQLNAISVERDTVKEQLSNATVELHALRNDVAAERAKVGESEVSFRTLQERLLEAEGDLTRWSADRRASEERLEEFGRQLDLVARERESTVQMLDEAREQLAKRSEECESLRGQLAATGTERGTPELEAVKIDRDAVSKERDELRAKLSDIIARQAVVEEIKADRDALAKERDDLRVQLSDLAARQSGVQLPAHGGERGTPELEGAMADRDALVKERDALRMQLSDLIARQSAAEVPAPFAERGTRELDEIRADRDALAMERDELRIQLHSFVARQATAELQTPDVVGTQELEKVKAHRDALVKERDDLRAQLSDADSRHSAAELPVSEQPQHIHDLQQQLQEARQHQQILEQAFRAQMEDAQRNLSSLTMEREALKRQLGEMGPKAPQVIREGPATTLAGSVDDRQLQEQNKQLQLRISAVEEEKVVMLGTMREHVMQLARENYDLRQQLSEAGARSRPQEADAAETQPQSGWLEYVLSPFLTDSDKREIHAEHYVEESLGPAPSDAAAAAAQT